MPKRGEIGRPVQNVGRGYKGAITGGLTGEEPGEETVTTGSEANLKGIQGWGGARVSDVGNDIFPPKREGGGYQGIGTMVLVWKFCAAVLNYRLKQSVILHDGLHGFRGVRVQGQQSWRKSWRNSWRGLHTSLCSRCF